MLRSGRSLVIKTNPKTTAVVLLCHNATMFSEATTLFDKLILDSFTGPT